MEDRERDFFRYDPADQDSAKRLDYLLSEFGVFLPKDSLQFQGHLIEHLVWRKAAAALENEGQPALLVFFDLDEGDEVQLLTIRAGEVYAVSHAELYVS